MREAKRRKVAAGIRTPGSWEGCTSLRLTQLLERALPGGSGGVENLGGWKGKLRAKSSVFRGGVCGNGIARSVGGGK